LEAQSGEFERLCARGGHPSIPPEKLLRALLLQAFYSVR
jgi:transposase